jgi:hypothetical protein
MPTPVIATKVYNTLRTKFSSGDVSVRVHGKTIDGFKVSPSFEEKATFWGDDDGYQATVYFIDTELPSQKVKSRDRVDVKDGTKWVTRRVLGLDIKCAVIYKLMLASEFPE